MAKKLIAAAFVLIAVTFVAACSDSGNDEVPPPATERLPSADEQVYLDEILEIDTLIGAVVVSVEFALEGSYATRGRLFSLVGEQDVYGTLETMIERVEAVAAPARYEADHQRYLDSLNESLLLAEELQPAIDSTDLVQFDVTIVELFVSRGRLLVDVSPSFCASALRSDTAPGCATAEGPPGGRYGMELHDAFRRFRAEFTPRVGAFPPAMNADEIFDELNILQPLIIESIETAGEEIRAIDPPPEFTDDHAIIERYFEDILAVSLAISQAAEERDSAAQRFEFNRSSEVVCEAALALSDVVKEITQFFDAASC